MNRKLFPIIFSFLIVSCLTHSNAIAGIRYSEGYFFPPDAKKNKNLKLKVNKKKKKEKKKLFKKYPPSKVF